MIHQYKDKPLNIYRASAGSGKTHLLTGFYIKLLFLNELAPETHPAGIRFSEILAVTFTNKATAEMKDRIIDELFTLNHAPATSHYWEDLTGLKPIEKDSPIPESYLPKVQEIKDKAKTLLVQILNEYSSFSISTIDSFFQKIVRSFAKELNIPGNYEVELEAERVLDAAISSFIDKLDKNKDADLFKWMEDFSKNRIEEGSDWDFRDALFKMANSVITSEGYQKYKVQIEEFTSDRERLKQYNAKLQKKQREWREALKATGEAALDFIQRYGLQNEDFINNGSGIVTVFQNLAAEDHGRKQKGYPALGTYFNGGIEDINSAFKKKDLTDQQKEEFHYCMVTAKRLLEGDLYQEYMTACAIRKHFFELGILANIDKEMTDYCNEHNAMLLSSTTEMLSKLVAEDDAPFIYEKTGTKIHSYMIDEFQDTSGMQWTNFKPLISNSLGEYFQNLIVGDVKQSIYRWRGGDWNLLNSEINSYEPDLHYDDKKSLTVNWRSLPNIVNFNNQFFPFFAKKLDSILGTQLIQTIYSDVQQSLSPKSSMPNSPQGLVDIEFLKPTDESGNLIDSPLADDYRNEAKKKLPEVIIKLQQNGFGASDIAILCRSNTECQWCASTLLEYKDKHPNCPYTFNIISDEALTLAARPTIQTIVSLMEHLQNPQSHLLQAMAWNCYLQLEGKSSQEALSIYSTMSEEDRIFHPELRHRPLYEMTEELIGLLPDQAQRDDAPFLQTFRDYVLDYATKKGADLSGFINWWKEKGVKKTISTPPGQDAIQIMTIHKSKGLGKPAIVIPYATWKMDLDPKHAPLVWCEPKKGSFQEKVLLPITLDKKLEKTIFKDVYDKERQCTIIDNINTAYVAFTRAKEAMVIMTPAPQPPKEDKKKKTAKADDKKSESAQPLEHWLHVYCEENNYGEHLQLGDWQRAITEDKKKKGEMKDKAQTEANENSLIPLLDSEADASLSLPQITILHDPVKPDVTAKERGNYIHSVLQEIRTANDAPSVISRLYSRGMIDSDIIAQEEMNRTINKLLKQKEIAPWFRAGLTILNEITLMDTADNMLRPDRIVIDEREAVTVIDYKTGRNHSNYVNQVRSYMDALQRMGFAEVSGYLLFLKTGKVERC